MVITNRLQAFLKRNLSLSIRLSKATGLERICLESYMKTNSKLVNVDETGVYTVQVTNQITVAKLKNEVNFIISSERGKLMTECHRKCYGMLCATIICVPKRRINGYFLQCEYVHDIGSGNGCGCCKENFRHLKTFCETSQSNEI
jgi:hypothetical protein